MGQLTKNEIFALAVQRYSDTVFRAAMHNCSCTADAEDVVQDVFEKLLCYNGRFESEEHLKAWLLRVTINRCHDLTRAARQKDTELDENLPAPDQMEDGSVLDAVRALFEAHPGQVAALFRELPQRGLPPLLRGVHRRRGGPDAGRTHQHGAQLASPRPRTVTYDAEGGDRR